MADKPKPTTKKRMVKSPETFRERAQKAAVSEAQPSRKRRVKSSVAGGAAKVTNPVFKPIKLGFIRIFNRKPFTWLKRPLRILGKILVPVYVRNSWQELKLVTWPNWAESRRLTYAVLVFAFIFGASIALVDYGLDKVFKDVLLK